MRKTTDRDPFRQLDPAVLLNQLGDDHFQRNAMKGIFRLKVCHLNLYWEELLDIFRE